MSRYRPLAYLYLCVLALLTVLAARQLAARPKFETNITALLPQIYRDETLEAILKRQGAAFASRLVVIARAARANDAETAASHVANAMRASGLFSTVEDLVTRERLELLSAQLLRHPFQLVEPPREQDERAAFQILVSATRERIFSPEGLEFVRHIGEDPLLLLPTYLERSIELGSRFTVRNGFIHADTNATSNVVINATLHSDGLGTAHTGAVSAFFASLPSYAPAEILPAGIVFFAEESASTMKREVTRLSSITFGALIVFLLWIFRSIWVVSLLSTCVATSFLGALYLSQNIWSALCGGSLHLLTIGFGSSLLGISPDYAIHYFVTHRSTDTSGGISPERRIRPALLLGYGAAIIGFLGIALSPFPGLQQLALFSYIGLTLALLTTLWVLPRISGEPRVDPRLVALARCVSGPGWSRFRQATLMLAVVVVCLGLPRLAVIDDIRALHSAPRALVEQQREAATLLGFSEGSSFLVVEGNDPEQVLQREELLRPTLQSLRKSGKLVSYRAVSQIVPSQAQQRRNFERFAEIIRANSSTRADFANELGLPEASVTTLKKLAEGVTPASLLVDECLSTSACDSVRDLWIGAIPDASSSGYASMIPLVGFQGSLQKTFAGYAGITAVNQADSISESLARYRRSATRYTVFLYALIFIILSARYGFRHSWRLCLPPLTGGITALATLGIFGIPVNVFSIFALLVLVGLSIDYAIFNAEDDPQHACGSFAVLVSAITTTISFGFLAFSSMPALMSFGLVLSIGVLVAAIVAPICHSSRRDPVGTSDHSQNVTHIVVLSALAFTISGCALSLPAPRVTIGKLPESARFTDLCPDPALRPQILMPYQNSGSLVLECAAERGTIVILNSHGVRTRTISFSANNEILDELTYLADSKISVDDLLNELRAEIDSRKPSSKLR